jgi:predicted Rossmann fold nucleotide-binding protein DprA/Smf involved in DNA uptake
MAENLIQLAERFVRQSRELDETRDAMKRLLLNGAGDHPARPTQPARPALGGKSQSQEGQAERPSLKRALPNHPNAIAAKEAQDRILEILRAGPRRMAELASETETRQSTTSERLRRLREKGLVVQANGAWQAVSAAPAPGG